MKCVEDGRRFCSHLQQQQQLPNSSRLCGVWGDPDVHDLTPMRTRHIERPVPTDPYART